MFGDQALDQHLDDVLVLIWQLSQRLEVQAQVIVGSALVLVEQQHIGAHAGSESGPDLNLDSLFLESARARLPCIVVSRSPARLLLDLFRRHDGIDEGDDLLSGFVA